MSPENPPAIPQGLATKLGKYGALVAAVLAALAGIFDVELNTESMIAFAGSITLLVTTIGGRMAQAAAMYRDQPSVLVDRVVDEFDELEDIIEEEGPTEEELAADFPDDPPLDPATLKQITPLESPEESPVHES